eukprot:c8577_g1_i2.p1 GENE.c8577_g1_i2~~c8577_g1_i2.p1  ORF type:complete len:212 (-),score=64.75 c8577_g1_i2:246-881(-)
MGIVIDKKLSTSMPSLQHTKDFVEFIFVSAPLASDTAKDPARDRAWWVAQKDHSGRNWVYAGVAETVEFLKKIDKEQGPFDGVLGFSQGAALASALSAWQHNQQPVVKFDFGVFVGGFPYNNFNDKSELFKGITFFTTPSLHVFSDKDTVVSSAASKRLMQMYDQAEYLSHTHGHIVPVFDAHNLEAMSRFLKKQHNCIVKQQQHSIQSKL